MEKEIGNNGNQAIEFMVDNDLLKNGMDADQIADIIRPFMINPNNLDNDDFWDDVFFKAEELGYILKF